MGSSAKCVVTFDGPIREMKTLATWLEAHSGIKIVRRDRSSAYSEAIKTAAPQAIQVADRFHLAQNLKSTVERFIRRNYSKITALLKPAPLPTMPEVVPPVPPPAPLSQAKSVKQLTPAQIRQALSSHRASARACPSLAAPRS